MAKNSSALKTAFIVVFILIFIPCCTFFIIYKTNAEFRDTTNKYMKNFPGFIGEYANTYATDEEKREKIDFLAQYYLSLSKEVASDKLYGIKKDNEELYYDIIKQMQMSSTSKTEDVLKIIRNREIKKDLMITLYDEIKKENELKFNEEIKRYDKLGFFSAAQEIEERYLKLNKNEEAANIISSLNVNKAAHIMYYFSQENRDLLFNEMSLIKKNDINNEILSMDMKKNALIDKAKIYESKTSKEVFEEIGNLDNYSIEELAQIYNNLSPLKAGEVLSFNKDNKFYNDLMDEIRKNENLQKDEGSITIDISKVMNFYKKYNEKINDLTVIYEKMNSSDVANIIERMIVSNNVIDSCKITNAQIAITDSKLIVDVLKNMPKTNLSDILNQLEPRKATEIIRRLSK